MKEKLGDEELLEIQSLTRQISKRIGFSVTWHSLLQEWEAFIEQCGRGYIECIDEYVNDIGSRILLQEILDKASPVLTSELSVQLAKLDQRFKAVTEPIPMSLVTVSESPNPLEKMLYFRIPIQRGGELEEDLQLVGI